FALIGPPTHPVQELSDAGQRCHKRLGRNIRVHNYRALPDNYALLVLPGAVHWRHGRCPAVDLAHQPNRLLHPGPVIGDRLAVPVLVGDGDGETLRRRGVIRTEGGSQVRGDGLGRAHRLLLCFTVTYRPGLSITPSTPPPPRSAAPGSPGAPPTR